MMISPLACRDAYEKMSYGTEGRSFSFHYITRIRII